MINKIQRYLLENYPLLWNIRLVPILLIIIAANLVFFGIGYVFTDTAFAESYYSYGENIGIVYFASIIIGILILIGWLIFYLRNNAMKVYYPRKAAHIYLEWILCFVICIGISFIPLSLTKGCNTKWKLVTTQEEAQDALKVIIKARMLIPNEVSRYIYNSEKDEPVKLERDTVINMDSVNLKLYSFDLDSKKQLTVKGYIGPSLLFYKDNYNDYYYYPESYTRNMGVEDSRKLRQGTHVKSWFKNEQSDSILNLMNDYMNLLKKQDLTANITANEWFSQIYKPPFFAIDTTTVILLEESNYYYFNDKYYNNSAYDQPCRDIPQLQYNKLSRGYNKILKSYEGDETESSIMLVSLCIALCISVSIFSCRVTSGKTWLKAVVAAGLLGLIAILFATIIITGSNSSETLFIMIMCLFWAILFAAILVYIIIKLNNIANKGYSSVPLNLLIWLVPCLIPLLFFGYSAFSDLVYYDFSSYQSKILSEVAIFWINIPIVIIAMAFIAYLVRRWKGLADE